MKESNPRRNSARLALCSYRNPLLLEILSPAVADNLMGHLDGYQQRSQVMLLEFRSCEEFFVDTAFFVDPGSHHETI